MSGPALAEFLLGEGRTLLEQIHAGHSIDWDGNNNVGTLTDEAQAAREQLEERLEELPTVVLWDAGDWLGETHIDFVWPAGTSLEDATSAAEAEAEDADLFLTGSVRDVLLKKAEDLYRKDGDDLGARSTREQLLALIADGRI